MFKAIACTGLYGSALTFIWTGVNMVPAYDWPTTDAEICSALLVTIGCICKLAGHVTLLSTTNR